MSIFDVFRLKKIKEELRITQEENNSLKDLLRPEHVQLIEIQKEIRELSQEKESLHTTIMDYEEHLSLIQRIYEEKKNSLLAMDDQILLESFSLYEPRYDFQNSALYKEKLELIRNEQKEMIKNGTACVGSTDWSVNNSKAQGKKMVNDMVKIVLRSFNNECDSCISNVKFNNIQICEKRINSSFDNLNKLGKIMQVCISEYYLKLKFLELYLAHEYKEKKQQEKEEQKQIREQMREEAKLQKEIEDLRKNIEKERKHYSNALQKVEKQLENCSDEAEAALLRAKISELSESLTEIEKQTADIDYREANQRAGYVYVISNIGSFGENVYKIGMTRRLDPYDRVHELGDASVPFNFDVHAMIFSNDAPKLEATLHRAFDDRKLNLVNSRREFFRVTLKEIEDVVLKNHDNTAEFIRNADAEQYRESLAMRKVKQPVNNDANPFSSGYLEVAVSSE
ncbi:hypothetical protein PAECIP112173_02373 [Paenibacillus sp. JJ-100]|uniref:DUF4041 domain-containing protein n=1 Tax=Paenibacillus sp. JJ-100 TaxID=2974896 RepID=UPI0022FFB54C|nr:DUF4041 domain-containing protein [Paenibacillus sp. JJ-100]CAI6075403.1 hypothetical protein PAECIP112173_02373 [Paenibacillus sp. JJ-100]